MRRRGDVGLHRIVRSAAVMEAAHARGGDAYRHSDDELARVAHEPPSPSSCSSPLRYSAPAHRARPSRQPPTRKRFSYEFKHRIVPFGTSLHHGAEAEENVRVERRP